MSAPDHFPDLITKLEAIRERVRRRVERTLPAAEPMSLPSIKPLTDQQGEVESLASAIGQLNPRPPGLANELAQKAKRTQARLSEWQLRPQREFNHAVAESLATIAQILESIRQSLLVNDSNIAAVREAREQLVRDMDSLSEYVTVQVESLCDHVTRQRWAFEGALMRHTEVLEPELQSMRQRLANMARSQTAQQQSGRAPAPASSSTATTSTVPVDYFQLERYFRGSEEEIRKRQSFYLAFFSGRKQVLDIACGRGEFLELMREAGVSAKGVDLDGDMIGRCLEKRLDVKQADVFTYLNEVPDGSLDGIFSAQFVEHMQPETYLRLIAQCAAKLAPRGVLALETQNPECLAIFSQSFYLDPTHVRPIPAAQLRFAMADAGFERITTHYLSPAAAILPTLPALPAGALEPDALQRYNVAVAKFNETFFGGMDYAVIGYRVVSVSGASAG